MATMTKPTRKSLDEAAKAAGYGDWVGAQARAEPYTGVTQSISAHALTLDQLHGRVEMSEAEELYRAVMGVYFGYISSYSGILNAQDKAAVALIEAALARRDAKSPPEWIEWDGGECPAPNDTPVEVKFRDGNPVQDCYPQGWNWGHNYNSPNDIIAYRVL